MEILAIDELISLQREPLNKQLTEPETDIHVCIQTTSICSMVQYSYLMTLHRKQAYKHKYCNPYGRAVSCYVEF